MIITAKCGCGHTQLRFDSNKFERQCIQCTIGCKAHYTYTPQIGHIICLAKEQQCSCYEIRMYKNADFCCSNHLKELANWYDTGTVYYTVCIRCLKCYVINTTISNQTHCLGIVMAPKPISKDNYVAHYVTWCQVHSFKPLRWDILTEIFFGCETDDDYKHTLETLYLIQDEGFSLSFMNDKQLKEQGVLIVKLKIRLELFKRVPSGTNLLLAYALMEEVALKKFSEIQDLDDRLVDKFDKCKALAINTKHIPERKVAFDKSVELFKKFAKVVI